MDPLSEEMQFYLESKAELLRTVEGKFALIKGRRLIGTYDAPDRAYAEGVATLGNVPMLIIQVQRDAPESRVPALTLGLIHADLSH